MNENYNLDIEQIILGECINSIENLLVLMEIGVTLEDFYKTEHQKIYEGMMLTFSKHNTIDIGILSMELKEKVLPSHLSNMFEGSIRSKVTDMKAYIKVLLNLSKKRKYDQLAKDIQNSNEEDLGKVINERVEKIEESLSRINNVSNITTLNAVKLTDIHEAEKINTGLINIDRKILGFITGSLVIITGYSGSGKSTIINQMCIAESIAQGYKVFAYSPELTNSNFKNWLYSTIANEEHFIESNAGGRRYKKVSDEGTMLIDEWIKNKLYLYSDDSNTFSEAKLLMDMERLAKRESVRVFVIDNLMKIELEGGYKNELLAQKTFVNKLKEFARKHNAVVHLVAHLKKPQQVGKSKAVTKFDVAGSVDITNLADYVISVGRVEEELRCEQKELKDCVLKFMKDRPSGNGEFFVNLHFERERRRFYEYPTELNKDYGYV